MARETIEGLDGDMVDMVVAVGRTVVTANDHKMVEMTSMVNGREVTTTASVPNPGKHTFYEREVVRLPRDEAERLQATGFVVRPGNESGESRPAGINNARGAVDPNAPEVISANKL